MSSDLHARISQSWQRLAALDRERSQILNDLFVDFEKVAASSPLSIPLNEPSDESETVKRLSGPWKLILKHFSAASDFNATEIEKAVHKFREDEPDEQKKLKKQRAANIRTQLCAFEKKGIIRRIGHGRYVVSPPTKRALGFDK